MRNIIKRKVFLKNSVRSIFSLLGATALAFTTICLPNVYLARKLIDRDKGLREEEITRAILKTSTDVSSANNIVRSYFIENPSALDNIQDVNDLMYLSNFVNGPYSNKLSNSSLGVRVKTFGSSRIDFENNFYFCSYPLSSNVVFIKEIGTFYDQDRKTLFRASPENHRLDEPITEVKELINIGNEFYAYLEGGIFSVHSNGLQRLLDGVTVLKKVHGTPFRIASSRNNELFLLGNPSNQEETRMKQELKTALEQTEKIRVRGDTRFSFLSPALYVNDSDGVVNVIGRSIREKINLPVQDRNYEDYLVLSSTNNNGQLEPRVAILYSPNNKSRKNYVGSVDVWQKKSLLYCLPREFFPGDMFIAESYNPDYPEKISFDPRKLKEKAREVLKKK
jgi:hypothetical protein